MCVARRWVRVARRRFGPRWRSGRSPSTPVRYRRLYPTFPHNATQLAHFLPRMSTLEHCAPRESAKKQGFRRWEIVGRSAANLCKTACRSPFCTRSCRCPPLGGPSVRRRVPSVGRSGIPVYRPALEVDLSPTMRANEDHASARPDSGACAERRDRRRLRLVKRERRRRRSRRADSGRRPAVHRGRRAPGRPGPQRPRGRAEEDPAHRRPGREDPATRRQQRQERRHHLQGRRRAVGGQPRRLRHHCAAQRPERRLRRGHRLHGRRQGREAAGQAEGHRQALLQRHRLPLRRQGEDGDRAHRPPRRGRHRGRAEGHRRRQGQGPSRPGQRA